MAKKTPSNGAESEPGLPLFFVDPRPITLERHRNAGLRDQSGVLFARETNSIPLSLSEFAEAARSYPIVFTAGEIPSPIALVGFGPENYFVDAKGQWRTGHYIPAYVRKYPFALLESPDKEQWILCVDEKAKEFAPVNPEHPFYEKNNPAPLSQRALEFCTTFQQHHRITQDFCHALRDHGLLTERVSSVKMQDGSSINLRGFLGIDEEKLNQLPDEIYLEWRRRGWMLLLDAVMISSVNWKYLGEMAVVARKAS